MSATGLFDPLVERALHDRDGCRFIGSTPAAKESGWRFWVAQVDPFAPAVLVPWVLAAMDTRVNGDTFRATCLVHDDPPEPSCVCGMYGTASLLDALFYVDRLITIPSFSRRVPEFIVPVVARAEFRRVLHMHYPVPGYGGAGIREIRATLVRIERLYVLPPAERPRRPYVELAARLGATYGVETSAEYPRYTRGDFDIHTAWTQHRQPHAQPIFVGTVTKPAAGQSISARRLGVVPAW